MVGVPTGPSHRLHTGHCRGTGREAGRGREGSREREGGKQGEGGSKRGRRVKREIWTAALYFFQSLTGRYYTRTCITYTVNVYI